MLRTYLALLDSAEDNQRFMNLYYANKDSLGNYANYILQDPHLVEDAVSEAFFNLARYFKNISGHDDRDVHNYLIIIVKNAAIKILNKRQDIPADFLEEVVTDDTEIELEHDNKILHKEVFQIVKSLKPMYSDVLILKYYFDFKDIEIAKQLGLTLENAKIRLVRGRKQVKERVENWL